MENPPVFSDTFFAMGTRCDVVFPGVEPEFDEQLFQILKNEVIHLENIMSRFIPDSPIAKLNRAPKNKWLSVSEDLWEILTICFDFYQMSNGAFDISAAPLVALWKSSESPSHEEIEQARLISGFDKVEFDTENHSILFKEDGIEFDLGAIGKGIALDTIKPILNNQGIGSGIVSFGESSILALGNHPNGEFWPLGIRNQLVEKEYLHVFQAKDETITSSGTILRGDDGNLIKRKHIVSPSTGLAISSDKSISVKSESATMGEFISTTWLILPENDKKILEEQLKKMEILEVSYMEGNDYKTKLSIISE